MEISASTMFLRSIAAANGKLEKLSNKSKGIYATKLMNNLLIISRVRKGFLISEAMGKRIRIDESHGKRKGPVRRLAPRFAIVNQGLPCPRKGFLPRRRGLECCP